MSEFKHTPGPWIVVNGDRLAIATEDDEANKLGFVALIPEKMSSETMEADAALIAASPYLLSEMQRYLTLIERAESLPKIWAFLTEGTGIATANGYREAINKVTQP